MFLRIFVIFVACLQCFLKIFVKDLAPGRYAHPCQ